MKLIKKIIAAVAANVIFAIAPAHAGEIVYKEIDQNGSIVTYAAYGGEPMSDEQQDILNAVDLIFKEINFRKAEEGSEYKDPFTKLTFLPSPVSVASLNTRTGRVTTGMGMGLSIGFQYQKPRQGFTADFGITTTPLFFNTGGGLETGKAKIAEASFHLEWKF